MNTEENETAGNLVDVVIDFLKICVTPPCIEILAPLLKLNMTSSAVDEQGRIVVSQNAEDCFVVDGETLTTSPGLANRVIDRLRTAGLAPVVKDLRRFDVMPRSPEAFSDKLTAEQNRLLEAVGRNPIGRIAVGGRQGVFKTVLLLHRYLDRGKTLLVVPNQDRAEVWLRRLQKALDEPVKVLTGLNITPDVRLYVATPFVFQQNIGIPDDCWAQCLLVGKETITGNNALWSPWTLPLSRKLAIVTCHDVLSAEEVLRAEYVAGPEIYRKESNGSRRVEISVATPPETPLRVTKGSACEWKRTAIWSNDRRNRYVASVAEAAASADVNKLFQLGAPADRSLDVLQDRGGKPREAVVLVENEEHARELQQMLPGWNILSRNGETHGASEDQGTKQAGCKGRIVTMAHADQHGVDADVIVRADGTNTPWQANWGPNGNHNQQGIGSCLLIDIQDAYDAEGSRNAELRRRDYQTRGWAQNDLCRMAGET
jgi:hypothetical protein